jgi:hypothetical protein
MMSVSSALAPLHPAMTTSLVGCTTGQQQQQQAVQQASHHLLQDSRQLQDHTTSNQGVTHYLQHVEQAVVAAAAALLRGSTWQLSSGAATPAESLQGRLDRMLSNFQMQLSSGDRGVLHNISTTTGPEGPAACMPVTAADDTDMDCEGGGHATGGMLEEPVVQRIELGALGSAPPGGAGLRFANVLPPRQWDCKLQYSDRPHWCWAEVQAME